MGIVNGMVDFWVMVFGYVEWFCNNIYGWEIMIEEIVIKYIQIMEDLEEGCFVLIDQCWVLVVEKDLEYIVQDEDVNKFCVVVIVVCFGLVIGYFELSFVSYCFL